MAAEDAGGSGDLAILVNTEMIVLKGAVKAAASAGSVTGKVVNKALLSPFRLIQFCMKLHKQHIISTSDFKSFTQFMKACDGDYIIANLPTRDPEQLDKLMDSMTEVGITYCLLPDLDIQDSCQQIAIRGKDVAKWQALYESYVTNQLDLGGPLDFEELKALTSGNYKIKSLALGDASEDNEQLEQFLDILDERGVNYSVLPDLKYGDNHIQIAVANQSLQQFAAAIKAYLEEFPDAAKNLVEDITEQEYFDSGRMSEEDYMKTASPEIKEKTDPKNWQKGKNLNAQSFEQALAGKEVDRYETLKNRPGLIERYIPSQRVAARREDEIALQTGDREYVRIQEALSVDNGKRYVRRTFQTVGLDDVCDHVYFHRGGIVVDTDAVFAVAPFTEETVEDVQTLFHSDREGAGRTRYLVCKDVELGGSSSSHCYRGMYCFLHCQLAVCKGDRYGILPRTG